MNIEEKLNKFKKDHVTSLRELSPVMQQNYLALARMLIEKEEMPIADLVQFAHRIKNL